MSWNASTPIFLPLRSLKRLDVGVLARGDLRQRAAAEQRDAAHLDAVGAHDDRGVADAAAEIGIADADLLGDVRAALADLERRLQALGLVVALGPRDLERRERRQEVGRREQIGHLGLRLGRSGRRQRRAPPRVPRVSDRLSTCIHSPRFDVALLTSDFSISAHATRSSSFNSSNRRAM